MSTEDNQGANRKIISLKRKNGTEETEEFIRKIVQEVMKNNSIEEVHDSKVEAKDEARAKDEPSKKKYRPSQPEHQHYHPLSRSITRAAPPSVPRYVFGDLRQSYSKFSNIYKVMYMPYSILLAVSQRQTFENLFYEVMPYVIDSANQIIVNFICKDCRTSHSLEQSYFEKHCDEKNWPYWCSKQECTFYHHARYKKAIPHIRQVSVFILSCKGMLLESEARRFFTKPNHNYDINLAASSNSSILD
jgi:hypothetical protein